MTIDINKKRAIKKYGKRLIIVSVMQIFLFSALFASTGYAETTQQIEFPIKQVIVTENETAIPQDATFTYQLVQKTIGAPMPPDSDAGKFTFAINGKEEFIIESIAFENAGIFVYELSCTTDSKPNFVIDKRIFKIEVHVMSNSEIYIVIHGSDGKKAEEIVFEHIIESGKTNGGGSGNTGGSDDFGNTGKTDKTEEPGTPNKPEEFDNQTSSFDELNDLGDADELSETGKPKKPGFNPKTGAAGNQLLWTILMFLSGIWILIVFFINRKSNKNAANLSS